MEKGQTPVSGAFRLCEILLKTCWLRFAFVAGCVRPETRDWAAGKATGMNVSFGSTSMIVKTPLPFEMLRYHRMTF